MRPQRTCYCGALVSLPTRTRVVILQHPRERDMPIGTAHMATLCLPNSALHVGVDWQDSASLTRELAASEGEVVLLYPDEQARDLASDPPRGPCTLVVLDGTWWQARKLLRTNPRLAALPRVAFVPQKPSEYRIRREPSLECVSTIEAIAEVLPLLEEGPPERFAALLQPFRAMIDTQIACERDVRGGRWRHTRRPRRASPVMRLRGEASKLVCVTAEASAWSYSREGQRTGSRSRDELVYLALHRLRDGATVSLVVTPEHGLAPNTASQSELPLEVLANGMSPSALQRRVHEFLGDDSVLCAWGVHAFELMQRAGLELGVARFDMRQIARDHEQGKVGTMTDWLAHRALAPQPLGVLGRAGRRLAELARVLGYFCADSLPPPRRRKAEAAAPRP